MNASVNVRTHAQATKHKMLTAVRVKTSHAPHAHRERVALLLWATSSKELSPTASASQLRVTLHAMQSMAESGTKILKVMLAQHQERVMAMKKEKGKKERLENQVLRSSWLGLWFLLPPFSSEINNGSFMEPPLLVIQT